MLKRDDISDLAKRMQKKQVEDLNSDEEDSELLFLSDKNLPLLEPSARIRALSESASRFEIDMKIPARRYYRSGQEMVRMANVYLDEDNLENAYVLYLKFMNMFIEKIRQHPEFKTVPAEDRSQTNKKLQEVLPKTETLKKKLNKLFEEEYKFFVDRKSILEKRTQEKREKEKKGAAERVLQRKEDFKKMAVEEDGPKFSHESVKSDSDSFLSGKSSSAPTINRSTKPLSLMTQHSKGLLLREVTVPSQLMARFLQLAIKNTELNLETCGVLAGELKFNKLSITHLLIPKQKGSPDSCATEHEEELFEYQDKHDLLTLGWIHTHPSQTCFLSSVDLHTHCSYQLMMPEALAIVCAPKYQENCFYILTPHYGLQFIADCRQAGFHPHPSEPPLYMKAEHTRVVDTTLEVVDLRYR